MAGMGPRFYHSATFCATNKHRFLTTLERTTRVRSGATVRGGVLQLRGASCVSECSNILYPFGDSSLSRGGYLALQNLRSNTLVVGDSFKSETSDGEMITRIQFTLLSLKRNTGIREIVNVGSGLSAGLNESPTITVWRKQEKTLTFIFGGTG